MIEKLKNIADNIQKNLFKKFPSTSLLGSQQGCLNFLDWVTFFRRNIHRCASDYLGLRLHLYQLITLYFMGKSKKIVLIATRSAAKSFIIAIYACVMAILYPGIKIVVVSAVLGQSALIVSEKIQNELWNMSPALRREIGTKRNIKTQKNDCRVDFLNGSSIKIVPATENGRGNRSNVLIREEFRMILKNMEDSVVAPFQVLYTPAFKSLPEYEKLEVNDILCDIYISSSWLDNGHWMWGVVDDAQDSMLNDDNVTLLAFDESIVLKHKIKPLDFLKSERRKQDPLSWRLEFLNERVKENSSAYFPYELLSQNQKTFQPFYPRNVNEIRLGKKNPYFTKKQDNEIRIVSCDIALMSGSKNDNSVFTCMSAIPEIQTVLDESNRELGKTSGYRRRVDYMYSINGGESETQAILIRRLFEEYKADYIVLDGRSVGIPIYDHLAKPLYDPDTGITYKPLVCFNNDKFAERIKISGAEPKIYVVVANQKLNSDIAVSFKNILISKLIDLPVNLNKALEDILPNIKEYSSAETGEEMFFYESPFLETQAFISETNGLMGTIEPGSAIVKISEQGSNRKDRYTSISYGSYFIGEELERNLLINSDEYEPGIFVN